VVALFVALYGCAGSSGQKSTEEYADDSALTARVKAALAADPALRSEFITVQTVHGVVHLTGFSNDREQADRAVAITRKVRGVTKVKDDIVLRGCC
jgi:osmotically-inducible protein OsmY